MKKSFDLPGNEQFIWASLVDVALKVSDKVQFNILFKGEELENFFKNYKNARIRKEKDVWNKFYTSGDIVELTINKKEPLILNNLDGFSYWKNNFIEDPSFWIGEHEILASISHEDMVMVDLKYFEDIPQNIVLYDLPKE